MSFGVRSDVFESGTAWKFGEVLVKNRCLLLNVRDKGQSNA